MDFFHKLRSIKNQVSKTENFGYDMRKQWETVFASHLTSMEKKEIYLHADSGASGYLWHVFSYGKRPCEKGNRAELGFDKQYKDTCLIFFQHSDDVWLVEDASDLKAKHLLLAEGEYTDLYVVARILNGLLPLPMNRDGLVRFFAENESGWGIEMFLRKLISACGATVIMVTLFSILEEFGAGLFLGIYLLPIILIYGIPSSILADFLTRRTDGHKRMVTAALLHVSLGALFVAVPTFIFDTAQGNWITSIRNNGFLFFYSVVSAFIFWCFDEGLKSKWFAGLKKIGMRV
ncbi:DUF4275 family protein [Mesobacillus jeotgali]|uniref:DUF4275 family protein n=1 Tax=Mesobacillus jeotgali TaxID=129985 RepID=UPI0021487EA9|nr:DUF4275 family protein [Mesobacillus jeotgali]